MLQVGIKCLVDNSDQKKKSVCHIQEMRPQKKTCVVFDETSGENRLVPYSAIETIPSVSWLVPNYSSRFRSDKKRKRNWHSNDLGKSNNKCSILNEDDLHGIHYFTKTLHIPQQYCEYITHPQYSSNRFSKNDETSGGGNNKNVPTKKSNQSGEKVMKADNVKNVPAKRSNMTVESKSGGTELLNVEFEPHVHYGNTGNMGFIDTSCLPPHMDRGEPTMGHGE